MIYRPLMHFYGFWFLDKEYESDVARDLNQMNLNTRDIVVVHIGFRILIFSFFLRLRVCVENRYSEVLVLFLHFLNIKRIAHKHFVKQHRTKVVQF